MDYLAFNASVDIKFSAHDAFLEKPHQVHSQSKILESQII